MCIGQENYNEIGDSTQIATTEHNYFKISNPYHAYDLESGRRFYHEDVISKIKSTFEKKISPKMIVIQASAGSGKTSTLRQMSEDRAILGEKYISIYIDSDEYRSNEVEAYLFYIYKMIINGLQRYEIHTPEPDFWLEERISLAELTKFMNRQEQLLDPDKILILIFDEFDKLQRSVENPEVIHSVVKYFQYIIDKTSKIRLILAGERQIFELARKTKTENFFKKALLISIEEIFEAHKIIKLITNPVKGYISYDPAAIKYILEITGRNLFCQQMLCHYIFDYLSEQRRNRCRLNDVYLAAERFINDRRDDFVFFWRNIDWRYQIVVSALADETVTKKKGQKYFLEQSALLDAIFGAETFNFLKRLYHDRQINKFEGIRFDENPIKVPLFGAWVGKNHSFMDTIIDNWKYIADYVSLTSLYRIMELIPQDKIPLDRDIVENTIKFSRLWTELQDKIKAKKSDRDLVEALVHIFCDLLGFEIMQKPLDRRTYFVINMDRLNLGGVDEVLFFVPAKSELDDLDISFFQDEILRQDRPGIPSFILCFKQYEKIKQLTNKQYLNLILLEENTIKNILLSSHPLQVFTHEIILKQVKPSAISTYNTDGPATATFFGRQNEMGKIIKARKKNFAILGARKIGKTSLLKKIMDELPTNFLPIYLDLEAPQDQTHQTFLNLLTNEMSRAYYWFDKIAADFSNIRNVIRTLRQQTTRTPIFILDEIDALIKYDRENNYRLLKTFRSLFNEGLVHFIISGYEELFYEKHRRDSPLYNFCHSLQLDKLEKNEALDLVTIPMERIGVTYNNPDDRELMLHYTSQHPNLLQFFCVHLIEKIETHDQEEHQRIIFREDIESVYDSAEYESYIIDDFYLFFKEDVRPIERLIVLLFIHSCPDQECLTAIEINKLLKNNDVSIPSTRLTHYLDSLILRYILTKERGGKYRFALPIFPELLSRRYDLEDIIEEVIEDARKSL